MSVNGVLSNFAGLSTGVPQGSILGPLLFIMYSAEIVKSLVNSNTHAYVDDTQLLCHCQTSDLDRMEKQINTDLNERLKSSLPHNLKRNAQNCTLWCWGRKIILAWSIVGVPLPRVPEATNLDITVDDRLILLKIVLSFYFTSLHFTFIRWFSETLFKCNHDNSEI